MLGLKKYRESRAYTICFPQDLSPAVVVQEVCHFFDKPETACIVSLQHDTVILVTDIHQETYTFDELEELEFDILSCRYNSNIFVKGGKFYNISAELDTAVDEIKARVLGEQNDTLFIIDYDLLKQKDLSTDIRSKSFRIASQYNDSFVKRKLKVTCTTFVQCGVPAGENATSTCTWLPVKRKRQNGDKLLSAVKRKYSKLVRSTKNVRKFSNQNSSYPISHSSVTREREQTKTAKGYCTSIARRKRNVKEDTSEVHKSIRIKITSKPQASVSRRSKSLENRRPQTIGLKKDGKQKSYRECEDIYKVERYFGKENDALSLKPGKKNEKENNDRGFTSWLRERTNLPLNQRPVPRQEYVVFPAKKKRGNKPSSAGSSSQRQDTDRRPVQVSDAVNEPSLPPREQIVTSAVSVYRQNQLLQFPPPTCNVMTFQHEQALIMRLHGLSNRSRHGRAPPPAKHPQYSDTAARRASYNHWPRETHQDPNSMSNYGFFHTGRVDLVRCFQCGIGLKDWSEPDEPLFEHIKHSPECPFLLRLLGPELLAAYKVNLVPGSAQPTAARPPPVEGSIRDDALGATGGATPGLPDPSAVRSPQYADLAARLRSFDSSWSRNMSQSPLEVAEAGFYYTGDGDVCRCFTCDGGLTHWDPQDDPWVEHAKWFPTCAFVRQVKGDEYVNLIQQAIASTDDEDTTRTAASVANLTVTAAPVDPLTTPAAQGALEMGYARTAVSLAIHELEANEKRSYSAADIVEILTAKQDRGEALPTDSPPAVQSMNTEDTGIPADRETLERDNTRLRNILKCMRCEDQFANMLFIPCTHHRLCESCSTDVTMCPVCGRAIEKKVKTYMS